MLAKLASLGISLSWDRVLEVAGEAAVGRPHIARVMVEDGHVASFQKAFSMYLRDGGPAYAKGAEFGPEKVVELIHSVGGVSVLAHPWSLKHPELMLQRLAAVGLDGVEVFRDSERTAYYSMLSEQYDLVKSGGSDFHGIDGRQERKLGEFSMTQSDLDLFLQHCQNKWHKSLQAKVLAFAASGQLGQPEANGLAEAISPSSATESTPVVSSNAAHPSSVLTDSEQKIDNTEPPSLAHIETHSSTACLR